MSFRNGKILAALLSLLIMASVMPLSSANAVINPDFILPRDKYPYGGELRIAQLSDFPSLNPFTGTGASWYFTINVYECLVMLNPDWGISPWLAKSWDISEDGLTYTFHLFENVTWADGNPLTSEDVKFTFEGWKIQNMPRMLPYVKNLKNIDTPDKYTVVFHLEKRDSTFISRILAWPALCIVPKHIWKDIPDWNTFLDDDPKLAVGSGPFKLKEWKKGEYCTIVANENYWQGRPYLDSVTWIVIKMRDMQLMAFEKGELGIFRGLMGNEVSRFLKPEYQIFQYVDPGLPQYYANNRRRPGNDTAFRHALAYCVDRKKLIDLAMYGYGVEPTHMLPPPYEAGGWMPPEDVTYDMNLTKAAAILDEAGYEDVNGDGWREYPNGDKMELKMTEQEAVQFVKSGEVLIDALRNIGVNINLEVLGAGAFSAKVFSTHDIDLTYFRYGPGSNDPLEPLGWLTSWGKYNNGFYNKTYDDLYIRATETTDPEEKKELVFQMQRILADQMPYVPPISFVYLVVVDNEKFDGWTNPLPYSTISNGQMFPYFNLHLRGAPPAIESTLTTDVKTSVLKDESVTISATLMDKSGTPIKDVYIDFSIGNIGVGASKTDVNGLAKFTWVPKAEGNYDVKTSYPGSADYASCTSALETVTVGSPPPPPSPQPDYTPYYISAALVIVVIIGAVVFISRARKT